MPVKNAQESETRGKSMRKPDSTMVGEIDENEFILHEKIIQTNLAAKPERRRESVEAPAENEDPKKEVGKKGEKENLEAQARETPNEEETAKTAKTDKTLDLLTKSPISREHESAEKG